MVPRLNLVVLHAADPVGLAGFYSELGLEFVRHRHGTGPEHFACEGEGGVFEIYPATPRQGPSGLRLGFEVEDVIAAAECLSKVGASILSAPGTSPSGLRAVLQDPEGNKIDLTESRESSKRAPGS